MHVTVQTDVRLSGASCHLQLPRNASNGAWFFGESFQALMSIPPFIVRMEDGRMSLGKPPTVKTIHWGLILDFVFHSHDFRDDVLEMDWGLDPFGILTCPRWHGKSM
jgi:hypothetical protein